MTELNFYYLQVLKTTIMFGGFRKSCYLRNRKFKSINVMALSIRDIEDDEQTISPELQAKIEKVRREFREGKTISLRTHDDIDRYFESL